MQFVARSGVGVVELRRIEARAEPSGAAMAKVAVWLWILQILLVQARGAAVESGGLVVFEAEQFQTSGEGSGHAWVITNNVPGFGGTAAVQALPDNGASLNSVSASPWLSYSIQTTNSGEYQLWVRGWGPNAAADSIFLSVDRKGAQSLAYSAPGSWMWRSTKVTFTNAGPHTVELWMREDGAYVDRFVLAKDPAFVPSGAGPAETKVSVLVTTPVEGTMFTAGVTVLLKAETAGISNATVRFYADGALVGVDTNAPFSVTTWIPGTGAHIIRAVAQGQSGSSITSAPVNVLIPTPAGPTFRWAPESNRIYVEGGGTATLSQAHLALPKAPLCLLDPTNRIWFLGATLFVKDGAVLRLHGSSAGGDVNELRLRSDNSTADGSVAAIDADWGTIDLHGVKVVSWDQLSSKPDREFKTFGRAFIRARSRQSESMLQVSTLNVVDSEIGFLGADQSTSYGLNWNIVGKAPDVTLRGKVSGSFIHNSHFGVSTWSSNSVIWTGNTVTSNVLYGFSGSSVGQQAVLAANQVYSNGFGAVFRWASSSGRIYVTGRGEATLSDVRKALPSAPLTLIDPTNKIWYLGAHLFVTEGARLKLYGPEIGGDIGELRLKSDSVAAINAFVEVRGDWGWLDIRNTRITSWDSLANGPNTTTNYGRAYIRVRSKLDRDGKTPRESRMDIINSDIGYLGHHGTEAYGLSWKMVDTSRKYLPPGSTSNVFEMVKVYGDIVNSRIHHNFFGVYTYGAYGMRWASNEVAYNFAYGLDPHDDSDRLLIENNVVHDNGWHGIIASKRCDHGILRNNLSYNNGLDRIHPHGNGIMLHRSSSDWVVTNNFSFNNYDSGIAIFASDRILIANNVCSNNANAGIRMSVGSASNWVEGNRLLNNGERGLYLYRGNDQMDFNNPADPSSGLRPGRDYGNTITNNFISGSGLVALRVEDADSNVFTGNTFGGTNALIQFANSTNNLLAGNSWPTGTVVNLSGADYLTNAFFTTTTFKRQAQLSLRLENGLASASFQDDGGAVFDVENSMLSTMVSGSRSVLNLTTNVVGTRTNLVRTRSLSVLPTAGTTVVLPTIWKQSGNLEKAWTVQASAPASNHVFVVGELGPGVAYKVERGTNVMTAVTANAQGSIVFVLPTGSSGPVTFRVSPQ